MAFEPVGLSLDKLLRGCASEQPCLYPVWSVFPVAFGVN